MELHKLPQLIEAVKKCSVEESPRAKYKAKVSELPPPPPTHTIAGPQDEDEAREAAQAIANYLDEIHREASAVPFFEKLRRAGLLEGNTWKGTELQAGFAAYVFAEGYKDEGKPGKNGKQYDKYYQAVSQFSKFAGINKETLKRNLSFFRNNLSGGLEGAERYGSHEDEIMAVWDALA
jgi:hypothetical protein